MTLRARLLYGVYTEPRFPQYKLREYARNDSRKLAAYYRELSSQSLENI